MSSKKKKLRILSIHDFHISHEAGRPLIYFMIFACVRTFSSFIFQVLKDLLSHFCTRAKAVLKPAVVPYSFSAISIAIVDSATPSARSFRNAVLEKRSNRVKIRLGESSSLTAILLQPVAFRGLSHLTLDIEIRGPRDRNGASCATRPNLGTCRNPVLRHFHNTQ